MDAMLVTHRTSVYLRETVSERCQQLQQEMEENGGQASIQRSAETGSW